MISELLTLARFALVLLLVVLASFCIQVYVFSFPMNENLLSEAYLFNGLFAVFAFFTLIIINRRQPGFTGYVFMIFSVLKFLIFFLVFYPVYYQDASISRPELLSFFIPYSVCLVTELFVFVKR
jgi:hypothetical protein